MGVGISSFAAARMFLVGMDEEHILKEFDEIKILLRKCEANLLECQKQEYVIPAKLNTLKSHIDYNNKMYEMINVLQREWNELWRRMQEYKRQSLMN